jgi:hypothetical protein
MKKPNVEIIEFDVEIFEEKIFICISKSITSLIPFFLPALKSELTEEDDQKLGIACGAVHKDKKFRRIIWLRYWNTYTFIHEAYHTARAILEHAEITDEETGAYLIEYIVRKTYRKRTEKRKKRRKQ